MEQIFYLLNKARSVWFHRFDFVSCRRRRRFITLTRRSARVNSYDTFCDASRTNNENHCEQPLRAWWKRLSLESNELTNGLLFSALPMIPCRLIHRDTKPMPLIHCQTLNKSPSDPAHTHDHRSEARLRIDPKVLVFVETTYSKLGREIAEELVYNRIK